MTKKYNYQYFLSYLVCFILVTQVSVSQEQARISKIPTLNNHEFIPTTGGQYPFTSTSVSTYMGYGQTVNFNVPIYEINDQRVIGLTGDVIFADLVFKYQQRIRERLAFYTRFNLAARLGSDVQTVLGHGLNTITSFEIGWKIKLIEQEKFIMSTQIELQNHKGSFMNILGFVRDIKNDVPDPQITENVPVLTGGTGFLFAYGINDIFGLNFYSELTWGETYKRGENAFRFQLGGNFDVNFYQRFNIPIGLVLSSVLTSQPDVVYANGRTAKIFIFKIAYTKSTDFVLGIEWMNMITPMPEVDKDPLAQSFGLSTRYYF
jgi:hypothetical protein